MTVRQFISHFRLLFGNVSECGCAPPLFVLLGWFWPLALSLSLRLCDQWRKDLCILILFFPTIPFFFFVLKRASNEKTSSSLTWTNDDNRIAELEKKERVDFFLCYLIILSLSLSRCLFLDRIIDICSTFSVLCGRESEERLARAHVFSAAASSMKERCNN